LEARAPRHISPAKGDLTFYSSGDPETLGSLLPVLLGETGEVKRVEWLNDQTVMSSSNQVDLSGPAGSHPYPED
jgi:hypothetical protein